MLNNKLKASLLSITTIVFFAGCGGNKLDVLSYPTNIRDKVLIPEICMPQYKSAMPTVAVIDFTNNSTFGKAQMTDKSTNTKVHRHAVGAAGFVGLGVAGGYVSNTNRKSQTSKTNRNVDAKLSASITGPLETIIVNSGGAKLFSRSDMDKIDAELKFQDSGLIDPKSAVRFGKTSGVRFIITGSIDNVEQSYTDNSTAAIAVSSVTSQSKDSGVRLIGALLSMGSLVTDGMKISTKMTVKLLDVETGKIVFSKQLENEINIGKIPQPNYDQVVGGIKSAMLESLPALKEELAIYFTVKGYITKLKSKNNETIAQINVGKNYKVQENQLFKVYAFEENEDPLSGDITCDVIESTTKLRASQQISARSTWTTVEEGSADILKLGQLVQKTNEKAGFAIPKF